MSSNKMPEQYSLKWNNFHANLTTGFHGLFEDEDLVDVSLAVEGKIIQAHKVILSVCSPYFKSLFRIHPEKHPIVFLKDVGYSEVIGLLQFMYQGQVDVSQEQLAEFLRVAEMLQVKGLTSNTEPDTANHSPSSEVDPMIPLPILSTLSNKINKINNMNSNSSNSNNNNNHHPSQNNALKRKKPSTPSSVPVDNSEPIFKIVSVESLKKPKLVVEDAPMPASTNGTSELDPIRDSPSPQAESVLPTMVPMIPKIEPVEEYSESNFTDYSDIGESFMSHFMEEPASEVTPARSQQNYSSFTPESQPAATTQKTSTPGNAATSASAPSEAAASPNKLTSQQIMNIDVSLLQDLHGSPGGGAGSTIPHDLSRYEIAQVISKKLFYQGFYYRREKMTYNKKLMWKCISYSKSKCHSRIHTFDGRIIFNSDKHNHLPHSLEKDQSVFHSSQSQINTVYRDGHDFIGRSFPTTEVLDTRPSTGECPAAPAVATHKLRTSTDGTKKPNITSKLSLTKNICQNLQNIIKPLQKLPDETSGSQSGDAAVKENDPASSSGASTNIDINLSRIFSGNITEVPNSLGKLTKCAVKQELVTCTPEIC